MTFGRWMKKLFNPRPNIDYISDLDLMMQEFDKTHGKSTSQEAEIRKHERVFKLRDYPTQTHEISEIWEEF